MYVVSAKKIMQINKKRQKGWLVTICTKKNVFISQKEENI